MSRSRQVDIQESKCQPLLRMCQFKLHGKEYFLKKKETIYQQGLPRSATQFPSFLECTG